MTISPSFFVLCNIRLRQAVLASVCLVVPLGTWAQASSTLSKIRDAGTIAVGYRENSSPFSYLDARLAPMGYSVDICSHVVLAIKAHLGKSDLRVQWIPVTATTRFPMMVNGSLSCEPSRRRGSRISGSARSRAIR